MHHFRMICRSPECQAAANCKAVEPAVDLQRAAAAVSQSTASEAMACFVSECNTFLSCYGVYRSLLSFHLSSSAHASVHLSMDLSFHLSMHPSIDRSVQPSVASLHPSLHLSIHPHSSVRAFVSVCFHVYTCACVPNSARSTLQLPSAFGHLLQNFFIRRS